MHYDSYLHFIIYKAYFIYHDEAICKKARRNSQFKRLADIGLNDSAGLRLDHVDLIRFIGVYMGGCDIHTQMCLTQVCSIYLFYQRNINIISALIIYNRRGIMGLVCAMLGI